jgi:hypothetical protein
MGKTLQIKLHKDYKPALFNFWLTWKTLQIKLSRKPVITAIKF